MRKWMIAVCLSVFLLPMVAEASMELLKPVPGPPDNSDFPAITAAKNKVLEWIFDGKIKLGKPVPHQIKVLAERMGVHVSTPNVRRLWAQICLEVELLKLVEPVDPAVKPTVEACQAYLDPLFAHPLTVTQQLIDALYRRNWWPEETP